MGALLDVEHLHCCYQKQTIVADLSFTVKAGEIAGILGPSGCGKTTVLRTIAGFNPICGGAIRLQGELISSPRQLVAPERRNIGMVFQDYALFPHLSVAENITFGLGARSRREKQAIVDHLLALIKLPELARRYPHELSGGQQQRIALARALAPKPKLLLMDEPFSNLDTELRRSLAVEVRDILKEEGITAIVVTHDQDEAFTVSDKLGILADGRLQQWDTPFNLYHHPVNQQVASFVGEGKFIPGQVVEENLIRTDIGLLRSDKSAWRTGAELEVFLRPHEIVPGVNGSAVPSEVVKKEFLGTSTLYTLKLPSGRLVESSRVSESDHQVGDTIDIQVDAKHLVAFPVEPAR